MASPQSRPATFYVVRGSADIRWRVELPVRHLKAKLVSMNEKTAKKELLAPHDEGKFPWRLTEEGAEYPGQEGKVAVWTRPDTGRGTHAAAMSLNGVRTLAELDDNYLSKPIFNIFMRMHEYDAEGRADHMRSLTAFDGIIFSTAWLRDEYHKAMRKELGKRAVPELFVCRNHVDAGDWDSRIPVLPPGDGRVRVGWMGSHQHLWDLRLAAPALRLAYDMGCEIVFIGLDPAMWDPAWRQFIPVYTHVPFVRPALYHKLKLNLDIGLIPLVQNNHTDGKSDVKFLEYAMSGVASVVQSAPIYNKTVINGETGVLASGPDDMAWKMHDLIKHTPTRQRMGKAARQWVLENRTMQVQGIEEWNAALGA